MHKYSIFIYLIFSLFSSELIAQNLSLKIIGSTNEETKIINEFDYNKIHINYNSILNEVDSLQQKIIKTGYIESERSSVEKINDSSFQFKFQLKNKYKTIHINYNALDVKKKDIALITENSFDGYFSIPFITVENTLQFLSNKIANDGFSFSKLKLSAIKIKDKTTLEANLVIIKNEEKRSLNNIVIKGYEKFPKSYLKRFLKIKPEKVFNIESIKNKMNALNNLRFAKQTKAPEVLFTKDSTTLYMYLEKSQSNTFDGFLGFSTNEETSKIDFNGYLNLQLNNNFNYGESFSIIYKSDESEQKNFEANLILPYLFSTPLGTELSLKILKRDSTFTTIKQKTSVFYQLSSKNRLYLGIESTESNNLLNQIITTIVKDYKSNNYNFKYTFENRDNFNNLFELKSNINIEFGLGKRKTINNKENQESIALDAFHIFQLNKKNSFYTKLTGALLNSNNYFENELFRFGGINSIRGFQENSIIANQFVVVNTEYRYQLSNSIYTHTIIDFSNFENKITNIKENLYGFGLGFGIATKAGLLKFNFANGKTETQNFRFSNSKIHISLVSVF